MATEDFSKLSLQDNATWQWLEDYDQAKNFGWNDYEPDKQAILEKSYQTYKSNDGPNKVELPKLNISKTNWRIFTVYFEGMGRTSHGTGGGDTMKQGSKMPDGSGTKDGRSKSVRRFFGRGSHIWQYEEPRDSDEWIDYSFEQNKQLEAERAKNPSGKFGMDIKTSAGPRKLDIDFGKSTQTSSSGYWRPIRRMKYSDLCTTSSGSKWEIHVSEEGAWFPLQMAHQAETAYMGYKDQITYQVTRGGQKRTYELNVNATGMDVGDMEQTNKKSGYKRKLRRTGGPVRPPKSKPALEDADSYGSLNMDYFEPLAVEFGIPGFTGVRAYFKKQQELHPRGVKGNNCPKLKIDTIMPILNPQVFARFKRAKAKTYTHDTKTTTDQKTGKVINASKSMTCPSEQIFFHGCRTVASAANIQDTGWMRTKAKKSGMLGDGIYFATDPQKAYYYAKEKTLAGKRFMFVALVNVEGGPGKEKGGIYAENRCMDEWCIYDDEKALPMYLITFHEIGAGPKPDGY